MAVPNELKLKLSHTSSKETTQQLEGSSDRTSAEVPASCPRSYPVQTPWTTLPRISPASPAPTSCTRPSSPSRPRGACAVHPPARTIFGKSYKKHLLLAANSLRVGAEGSGLHGVVRRSPTPRVVPTRGTRRGCFRWPVFLGTIRSRRGRRRAIRDPISRLWHIFARCSARRRRA